MKQNTTKSSSRTSRPARKLAVPPAKLGVYYSGPAALAWSTFAGYMIRFNIRRKAVNSLWFEMLYSICPGKFTYDAITPKEWAKVRKQAPVWVVRHILTHVASTASYDKLVAAVRTLSPGIELWRAGRRKRRAAASA
jgi:hypothetical protein